MQHAGSLPPSPLTPATALHGVCVSIDDTVLYLPAGRGPASMQGARPHGAMDESFVDLGAASLLRQMPSGALQASSLGAHPQSFDDMFDVLARTFDMASGATQVTTLPA